MHDVSEGDKKHDTRSDKAYAGEKCPEVKTEMLLESKSVMSEADAVLPQRFTVRIQRMNDFSLPCVSKRSHEKV
jgi:hypothetical protein